MDLRERMKVELTRRVKVLGVDLSSWQALADSNVDGFGIHQNQMAAIALMMSGLDARQRALVAALEPRDADKFADDYLACIEEFAAVQDVYRVFQGALLQRSGALKARLDAADLIAADCYKFCTNNAETFRALKKDEKRPPPLVIVEARTSIAAVGRGQEVGLLGHSQLRYRDLHLTVPIVLLPPDQLDSVWLLCAIYHEVGHNLDQDLGLEDALKSAISDAEEGKKLTADTAKRWRAWTKELLADAFGVLFGGGAFVHAVATLLNTVSLAEIYGEIDEADTHPNPFLRTPVLCAMVELLGVAEWTNLATEARAEWDALPKPAWVAAYQNEASVIAHTFLDAKLDVLGTHSLKELVPPPDQNALAKLRDHLLHDLSTPMSGFHRYVPAGAQLAVAKSDGLEKSLDTIQARTMRYLHEKLSRPDFLFVDPVNRGFLEKLTAKMSLRERKS